MDTLKRLVTHYLLRYWKQAVVTYVCMTVTTITGLIVPMIIRNVIDVGLAGRDSALINQAALIVIGISAASALFSFGQRYLHAWLAENLAYDIRNDLYDHLQHLSFAFHDRTDTGQLISRCTSDVGAVLRFAGWAIMQAINTILMTAIALTILFTTDWKLAAVSILPLPVVAVMAVMFRQRIRPIFRAIQQQFAVMTTVLQENLLGAQVVRAFAREQHEIRKFNLEVDRVRRHRLQAIRYWVTNNQANIFLFSLCTTLLLIYGGPRAIRGEITVGVLVAFSSYLALLAGPIQSIGEIVNSATEATAAGERIFEILDTASEVADKPGAVEAPPFQGTVSFENVSFRYSGRETGRTAPLAISDVSFTIAPNQTIAIVGPTGSGKSTLVSLIPRFYDVTDGVVKIDGIDIRDFTLESLRRQVGIVMQEPLLFTGTVRENIAYGRADATDEEIIRAARIAQAHDFISEFPDGYDTFVGERGYTLSGGQRQRVSIARAILLDPRVLILDDATAAVDTETEHQIQQALAAVMVGRTTFVIAQRLTTAKGADLVLVMDHGRVIERGTHAELLEQGGLYRRIYDMQLRDQEEQLERDALAAAADRVSEKPESASGEEDVDGRSE